MAQFDVNKFKQSLLGKKIPLLVLDNKWHHLFKGENKTEEIIEAERIVNEQMQRQSKLNEEIKEYKKLKNTLMQSIVDNMDGAEVTSKHTLQEEKLDKNKEMIEELNQKIEDAEDELLEVPHDLQEANLNLMILSMCFCYEKLHSNDAEAKEIAKWITSVRVELKKKIIKKQYCETKNREMYAYMDAILGPEVLDVFDIQYDESFDLKTAKDEIKVVSAEKKEENKEEDFKTKES